MNLLDTAASMLTRAEYHTSSSTSAKDLLHFEGDTIVGYVAVYDSVAALLESWEERQDSFLRRHAGKLRSSHQKAWNIYSIFLVSEEPTPQQESQLRRIEEDFHATRKIVCAARNRDDIRRALAAILPLSLAGVSATINPEMLLLSKLSSDEEKMLSFLRRKPLDQQGILELLTEPQKDESKST